MAADALYFLHLDDPVFEAYGGIYIPYATEEEALAQAANDLLYFDNDAKALGLKGIFKAEYGGHARVQWPKDTLSNEYKIVQQSMQNAPNWGYDYNDPFGHLNPEEREAVHSPSQIVKVAKKFQKDTLDAMTVATDAYLRGIHESIQRGIVPDAQMTVPGNAYSVLTGGTATGGAVALVAATAKTVVGITAGAANQPSFTEFAVSFDGTNATAVPVLVEAVSGTAATTGTSTAFTPKQIRGWPAQASQNTAGINYTVEPTVLESYKKRLLTPNGGVIIQQQPMGREHTGVVTSATQFKFVGTRLTAPAAVNCHVDAEYEE